MYKRDIEQMKRQKYREWRVKQKRGFERKKKAEEQAKKEQRKKEKAERNALKSQFTPATLLRHQNEAPIEDFIRENILVNPDLKPPIIPPESQSPESRTQEEMLTSAKHIISDLNESVGIPTGGEDESSPYNYNNPNLTKEALLELETKLKQAKQLREIEQKAKLKEVDKASKTQTKRIKELVQSLDEGVEVQHKKAVNQNYALYIRTKNRIKAELDLLTKSPEYANLGIELDQDLLIEAATNLEVRRNLRAKADKARKDRYDEKMKYQIEIDRRLRELEKKYKKYDYDPSKAGVSEHTQNMEELRSVMAKVSFNKGKDWLDILDDKDFVVIKEKVSKAKVWNAVIDAFNPDDMLKAVDKMPSVQRKSITGGNVDDRMQMLGMYLKVCKEDLMV